MEESGTVHNVQCAAFGPFLVDIDQNDFAGLTADHQGITDGFSHVAGANDDDLVFVRNAHEIGLPFCSWVCAGKTGKSVQKYLLNRYFYIVFEKNRNKFGFFRF